MTVHSTRNGLMAEATMYGTVIYTLDRIGTFTLGPCLSLHDDADDERRMHVGYGRWEQPGWPNPTEGRPVLFGIPIRGGCAFDIADVDNHLMREPFLRSGRWLQVQRADRGPGWCPAPEGTRARTAGIVADLVCDFRSREDYTELLEHHRHALAEDRARMCRERIVQLVADLDQLSMALDAEQEFLTRQSAHLEPRSPLLDAPRGPHP